MDYKEKVIALLNSQELSQEQKEKLEEIFPELKESEDERIMKEIIRIVDIWTNSAPVVNGIPRETLLAWLEKQVPINEEAEKEKNDYVSGQFLYCKGSFNEFKEGESYWIEYIGNDTYIGRSDNILNQKFHITPRQLYTWLDPRHPEKQGEQKPAENKGMNLVEEEMTPFQKKVFCIIDTTIEEEQGLKQVCDELFALASNEIKQNLAEWSEEDEDYLKAAIWYAENPAPMVAKNAMLVEWLKNLRGRVQPQPNKEWSEEDERNFDWLITVCERIHYKNDPQVSPESALMLREWLNSLKDRYTWKPSNEQMRFLWKYAEQNNYDGRVLRLLYSDLKILKEGKL